MHNINVTVEQFLILNQTYDTSVCELFVLNTIQSYVVESVSETQVVLDQRRHQNGTRVDHGVMGTI